MKKIGRIFLILICLFSVLALADPIPQARATTTMTASEDCVKFIKQMEGFSARPYYDYGQHTVGYGTKCPTDKYLEYYTNGIPESDAEALLRETIADVAAAIHSKLITPYKLSLNQHQFDALVSFSFNIGTGWMGYNSTLRNAIVTNAGTDELVYAFSLYCTAGGYYSSGLINRRLCEANIFLNGIYDQNAGDTYGYVFYDPNGGSLTYRVQGFLYGSNPAPAADAVRSGDVFLGWYTDLTGGTPVTGLTWDLTGKTLFARWQSSENSENQDSSSTVVRVTGDVVNIRKGPGTTYGISRQVTQDDLLVVFHVTHLANRKWGKVQDGWICLDYTNYDSVIRGSGDTDNSSTSPDDVLTSPETESDCAPDSGSAADPLESVMGVVRVNDLLRIRSGPGTAFTTVGRLTNGTKVEILEQRSAESTTWGRISQGWVCMDYITVEELLADGTDEPDTAPEQESSDSADPVPTTAITGIITADALRIRSAPGTSNPIVGFYYQNSTVTVLETVLSGSVSWGRTDKGWINLDYVQTNSTETESAQPSGTGVKTVIADCLRVRKEARTDSRIAQLLYYGDSVTILETKDVDGTLWGRVSNGWVCMDYVS